MLISHAAASAAENGCPKRGTSAATAAPVRSASTATAMQTLNARASNVDIGHLALRADAPAGNHVAVLHRKCRHRRGRPGLAALGKESGPARLHVARLVGRAAE